MNRTLQEDGSKETQLGEQMKRLQKAIEVTNDSVGRLRNRLEQFLRTEPPCADDEREKSAELVPFANEIRSKAEQIEQIGEIVVDITNRLEV